MKMPAFYPLAVDIPTVYRDKEFVLRPLRTHHAEIDYAALMVSREMLRRWGGGSWPADDFDLEGNLADLAEHEQEHESGVAFTFTMLNPAEDECLGCVYLDPLSSYLELEHNTKAVPGVAIGDFETVVRFWVKQPRLVDNLDRRLFQTLRSWLRDEWAFSKVFFRANSRDQRQVRMVEEAGLQLHYSLDVPGHNGQYLLYGVIRPNVLTDI